ncbi:MAG: aminoacyl-tRNA hydrolase [Spirochaetota bacterium]
MEKRKLVIAGLGNPGKKYDNTRHNVGFAMLDRFCESLGERFSTSSKSAVAKHLRENLSIFLIKPLQYMNLSGSSIAQLLRSNGIDSDNLVVIHDEIDFPYNRVKLKFSGGHAGHNGLRDIIKHLGTKDFHRIRVGVDKPENKEDVADYVLAPFSQSEKKQLDAVFTEVQTILDTWIQW